MGGIKFILTPASTLTALEYGSLLTSLVRHRQRQIEVKHAPRDGVSFWAYGTLHAAERTFYGDLMHSPAEVRPRVELTRNEPRLLSGKSVLSILKLILVGSPLPEVLTIIAQLLESQGKNMFCIDDEVQSRFDESTLISSSVSWQEQCLLPQ